MKNIFRILLSTVVTAAILWVLAYTRFYYISESTLGDTVDHVILLSLTVLAGLTVLLYLRSCFSLIFQIIRHHIHRKAKPATSGKP